MSETPIIEALKFVEEHSTRLFSDLQRICLTIFLIYIANPDRGNDLIKNLIKNTPVELDHYKSFLEKFAESLAGPAMAQKSIHTIDLVIALLIIWAIWAIFQLAVLLHDSILLILHNILPRFEIWRINTTLNEINKTEAFCYKYFKHRMNRDDFDRLLGIYKERVFKDVDMTLDTIAGRRFTFIYERMAVFLIAVIRLGNPPCYWPLILLSLLFLSYFTSTWRSADAFALALTKRAVRELVIPYMQTDISKVEVDEPEHAVPRWILRADWMRLVGMSIFNWKVIYTIGNSPRILLDLRKIFRY